ncbi:hypothetical protein DRQ50_01345 [bacterium]|nr:MAG: hypothetical protein DRQ50_01345 [bacterium]
MLAEFAKRTRCSAEVTAALAEVSASSVLAAMPHAELAALGAVLPDDVAEAVDYLRLERYQEQAGGATAVPGSGSMVRRAYYLLRPFLPVALRKHMQRFALRGWQDVPFPRWPVETAIEDLEDAVWTELLRITGSERLPFIWYWPEGRGMAAILTHDVETAAGRDFCGRLMEMEAQHDLVSAFEVVPEERYEVPGAFLQSLRDGGCEVALHGLNHDGHLFDTESGFRERAERINGYLRAWDARGFRSPVMYRRQEWLSHLAIAYDMSVPNSARLDPQRGGCCTIRPYFVGDILELPLTTIQDYTLLAVLNDATPDIWWSQLEVIEARGGLASFIVHPDYMREERGQQLYRSLLERLAQLRDAGRAWTALPGEVNDWWRQRNRLELVEEAGGWTIRGEGARRARVAWAVRDGAGIRYEVQE